MIGVVNGGSAPGQTFHRRRHAAFELIIIIRIQQVMFPVVLVLMDDLNFTQALFKQCGVFPRLSICAIGVSTPLEEDFGQIRLALPVASIQQG